MDKQDYEKLRFLEEQEKGILKSLFDESAKSIIAISEEAADVRIKFGENSKLYKAKLQQSKVLGKLYEVTAKVINDQRHIIKLMRISERVYESLVMQHEIMLTWRKIQFIHGIDSDKARIADKALADCMLIFAQLLSDDDE